MDKFVLIQIIIVLNNNLKNCTDILHIQDNIILLIFIMKQPNKRRFYLKIGINFKENIKKLNMLGMLLNKDKKFKLKMILLQDGLKIKIERILNKLYLKPIKLIIKIV